MIALRQKNQTGLVKADVTVRAGGIAAEDTADHPARVVPGCLHRPQASQGNPEARAHMAARDGDGTVWVVTEYAVNNIFKGKADLLPGDE